MFFYHKVQNLNYVYPRDLGKSIKMGAFVLFWGLMRNREDFKVSRGREI
jgi:hypothetical protein